MFDAELVRRVINPLKRLGLQAAFRRPAPSGLRRVGSHYGGWHVPELDSSWLCCTAGVGEDASFDLALVEHGCEVIAIDPTPRSVAYMTPLVQQHQQLHLAPYALWPESTSLQFYPPADPSHVSYSATNLQQTSDPITVPAKPLGEILHEFGRQTVDLLKLDIEGAEYSVLPALDLRALGVKVLCVEYHLDKVGLSDTVRAIRAVERRGYRVAHVTRTDVTFLRS